MLASPARLGYGIPMKAQFTYWQERDGRFLGYLNGCPDHWTQGEDLDDLKEHLRDLFQTFTTNQIPGIRKVEELEVA
jgi:predicted RNase H-like HicB family nuclease